MKKKIETYNSNLVFIMSIQWCQLIQRPLRTLFAIRPVKFFTRLITNYELCEYCIRLAELYWPDSKSPQTVKFVSPPFPTITVDNITSDRFDEQTGSSRRSLSIMKYVYMLGRICTYSQPIDWTWHVPLKFHSRTKPKKDLF